MTLVGQENISTDGVEKAITDGVPKTRTETILAAENVASRANVPLNDNFNAHHTPEKLGDKFAKAACDFLGFWADLFFKNRFGHRAVVLETVATLPGAIAAAHRTFYSVRNKEPSDPLIRTFMEEAENERMHLRIFTEIAQPTKLENLLIKSTHWGFGAAFSASYFLNQRATHRFVGYIEEKAVDSYTRYLAEIDNGNIENVPAPQIAIEYYGLAEDARLRDVVIRVRNDEMEHRDVNHDVAAHLSPTQG